MEELKEPLIGKEENLEPISTSSESRSIDRILPITRASTSKEKNKSISIDLVGERKEVIIHFGENLEPQAECCIYRVPRALRRKNEEAYTPKVISIGPLHHGKDELADMEKQKIRYKREFCKRITPEKWQQLINFIEENEKRIRDSYEENSKLEKLEFITMILYDAVFIIELFLRDWPTERKYDDFLLDRTCLAHTVWLDLQLLENQLPFFVLDGLYKSASPNLDPESGDSDPESGDPDPESGDPDPESGDPSFISLSCVFFEHCEVVEEINVKAKDILHFTDLSRYFKTRKSPEPEKEKRDEEKRDEEERDEEERDEEKRDEEKRDEEERDLPCAAKLQGAGVQFKCIEGECLLDINFKERKWFGIPCLKVAELQIPRLVVDDSTESLMRNMMALEQCRYPQETVVCNYVDFMDSLIDTDEDVNKLVEAGIISNNLGESARVTKMFNALGLEIIFRESNYAGTMEELKNHYFDSWNHAKATLKRTYFSNLWKGTGTVAALLLLVFNLIQAIWSIISAFA